MLIPDKGQEGKWVGGGLRGHAAPEWTGWALGHVAGKVAHSGSLLQNVAENLGGAGGASAWNLPA